MNEPYFLDPSTVKFDTKISTFNKPKSPESYEALKRNIEATQQNDPILMRGNLCGDGVNRNRIALELGRQVLAIDVDSNMSDADYILRCNADTFVSRNDSSTQIAIKAYKLTKDYGYTDIHAKMSTSMKANSKGLGFARTIDASPYGKKHKILDVLARGEAVEIDGSFTKSIEVVKRKIAIMEENDAGLGAITEKIADQFSLDYNSVLNTESARTIFWEMHGSSDAVRNSMLVQLLNMVYAKPDSAGIMDKHHHVEDDTESKLTTMQKEASEYEP